MILNNITFDEQLHNMELIDLLAFRALISKRLSHRDPIGFSNLLRVLVRHTDEAIKKQTKSDKIPSPRITETLKGTLSELMNLFQNSQQVRYYDASDHPGLELKVGVNQVKLARCFPHSFIPRRYMTVPSDDPERTRGMQDPDTYATLKREEFP
jgi:hypothetical protein